MCLSTSAVEQNLLDAWSITPQGQLVAQHLREILGKRENFLKGREHFEVPYPLLDSERVIDGGKISLPQRSELESALLAAGADSVIEGTKDSIAAALRSYLASREEKFRAYP